MVNFLSFFYKLQKGVANREHWGNKIVPSTAFWWRAQGRGDARTGNDAFVDGQTEKDGISLKP